MEIWEEPCPEGVQKISRLTKSLLTLSAILKYSIASLFTPPIK